MFRWRITSEYNGKVVFQLSAEDSFEMKNPLLMSLDRLKQIINLSKIKLMQEMFIRLSFVIPIQDFSEQQFQTFLEQIHTQK